MSDEKKDTTYNGWTNYETWNLKLWIDNDKGLSELVGEMAQEEFDSAVDTTVPTFTKLENARHALCERLKDHFEEEYCEVLETHKLNASWVADFLGAAFSEVNFREIAGAVLEDNEIGKEAA